MHMQSAYREQMPKNPTNNYSERNEWPAHAALEMCVAIRYSCVERAGPTLCIRRRSLCASGLLCMHKHMRGARRMNVHPRRTPEMRRERWNNAGHTRGTRGAHAGHTRGTRWACVVCSLMKYPTTRGEWRSYLTKTLRGGTSLIHVVYLMASTSTASVLQTVVPYTINIRVLLRCAHGAR